MIGLTCCPGSEIERAADIGIPRSRARGHHRLDPHEVRHGSEDGAEYAFHGTMVKLGKVYGNLMVDVKPSNEKLVHRCISIVREATGADEKDYRRRA